MVVAFACECCCETGGCNNEFAFRRLHLGKFGFQAVGSSTSSGGDNKKKPTGEHEMLQPVGQGINTQSILAAGCCIVSGMACENV